MTWFVLRVRSRFESEIAKTITDFGDGFRGFCPTFRNEVVDRGRRVVKFIPLWSTYVLADWPSGGEAWHRVMNIDGVSGVIGGIDPTPVAEIEVADWLAQADKDGVVTSLDVLLERIKRGYGRGDAVKIEGGTFDGQRGICSWYDNSGVSVKIALLGREVNLYVSLVSARVVKDDNTSPTRSEARRERRRRRSRSPAENLQIFRALG
jgi:transcription antitermination factor NusG